MPDEITPEQRRAWGDNPFTQKLLHFVRCQRAAFEQMKSLEGDPGMLREATGAATALRWVHEAITGFGDAGAALGTEEPTPVSGPRRVRVNG